MSEMIEEVARAMFAKNAERCNLDDRWDDANDYVRSGWIDLAQSAMTAMRYLPVDSGQRYVEHLQRLQSALPEKSRMGRKTIREVCLTLNEDGTWRVLAGGHPSVHIGEWGGDFDGDGQSAEDAIAACLKDIKSPYAR